MKKKVYQSLVIASVLLLVSSAAFSAECSGSWSVLSGYTPGSGGACAMVGLNTHQAVCQPGQNYATYCDDASGGRYRICQSNVPCLQVQHDGYGNSEHSRNDRWNSHDNRWDSRDNRRGDRYDRREDNRYYRNEYQKDQRNRAPDCTQWDYTLNRPCAPGTVNRDCLKSCGGR